MLRKWFNQNSHVVQNTSCSMQNTSGWNHMDQCTIFF